MLGNVRMGFQKSKKLCCKIAYFFTAAFLKFNQLWFQVAYLFTATVIIADFLTAAKSVVVNILN